MVSQILFYSLLLTTVLVTAEHEEWLHCSVLDSEGKYQVCWLTAVSSAGQAEIVFGVEVQTHGYVGFGLSYNGGMAGSDIITGWIKDGKIYCQDRHGIGNTLPIIDISMDWECLRGSENDTHTSLVFRRKLDTCDEEDLKIDDSTIRLIYAYSDIDPLDENDLDYHMKNRGAKSVLLLQPKRNAELFIDKSQLSHWDVLSPNFTISSEFNTLYWCKIYRAPALPVKHHIVLVEPLIQKGHEPYVHHLLLYECVGANPEEYDPHLDKTGHQCYRPNMPDVMSRCEGITLAWAIGGEDLILPDHVGLPLESGISRYYMLEIHYDNPFRHDGIVDRSGFRIYYTNKLREYDAGSLMFGSTVSRRLFIPPKQKEYTISGHSNPLCLDPSMPKEGIKILGTFLHAHLLARHVKARHFRNNTELQPLADDRNYDFNYQEYRYYSEEIEFLPGDQATMECTYDSSEKTKVTFGGEGTDEEMCLGFLLYYPKIEKYASVSVPTIEEINAALGGNLVRNNINGMMYRFLIDYNWNKIDFEKLENNLRYSYQDTHCYLGDGNKNSIRATISYPDNLQLHEEKLTCISEEEFFSSNSIRFLELPRWKNIILCLLLICSGQVLHKI